LATAGENDEIAIQLLPKLTVPLETQVQLLVHRESSRKRHSRERIENNANPYATSQPAREHLSIIFGAEPAGK
jgi:hypothetical protein